jgi:heptosyltransferase II
MSLQVRTGDAIEPSIAAPSLLVRLPNHLGDACMSLPALRRLDRAGYRLALAGRPWSAALFAGCGWPVLALPVRRLECIRALRAAAAAGARGLLLTNSLSTALEFRLAGIAAAGYATDGRRWLLGTAVRAPAAASAPHMVAYYAQLADAALRRWGHDLPALALPPTLDLTLDPDARQRAAQLLATARTNGP